MALSVSQTQQRSPSESSSKIIGQRLFLNLDTPYNTQWQLDWKSLDEKREYKNTMERFWKQWYEGIFSHSHMSKFEAVQNKVRI